MRASALRSSTRPRSKLGQLAVVFEAVHPNGKRVSTEMMAGVGLRVEVEIDDTFTAPSVGECTSLLTHFRALLFRDPATAWCSSSRWIREIIRPTGYHRTMTDSTWPRRLALALALTCGQVHAQSNDVLVRYDFDAETVETGPYTLIAYENAKGSVSLTTKYRFSGSRSVEIRDVAGDGEFAELQGFFREMPGGKVYVHFAFLIAEPAESMNIALAGEGHFAMRRNGFGFWLEAKDGHLFHVTKGKDVKLFPIQAFTWYVTDVAYDVDRGTYDLTVAAEGRQPPLVSLRAVPNPVGVPGSRIHKFSFIGDPPGLDRSNARFYVDDIVVRADRPVPSEGPFVAPGRRMLFVDIYRYYRSLLYEKPQCLPALGPEDFGLGPADMQSLASSGSLKLYDNLADRKLVSLPAQLPEFLRPPLEAMVVWGAGCRAPPASALPLFERAHDAVPAAKLYGMARVLALAAEKRWPEADALFAAIHPDWRSDPRFPAVSAILGMARGDLEQAEIAIGTAPDHFPVPADAPLRRLWSGDLDQALVRDLTAAFPNDWADHLGTFLTAEHRYFVLVWRERYEEARAYADQMAAELRRMGLPAGNWLERRGDALLWMGDSRGALQSYEESLTSLVDQDPVFAKLSDVYFTLGDFDRERFYREKVYGSLRR